MVKRLAAGVIVFSLVSAGTASAQASAQISGAVRDASGAVLPGADVTVTQLDTNIKRSAVTDASGDYTLQNLPIGPYRLEVMLQGFRTYAQTGIVLQVNASPVINVVLSLGELAETVSVEAAAPLVETRATGIGQVVENERILALPLNGRNPTDLIVLAGGAWRRHRPIPGPSSAAAAARRLPSPAARRSASATSSTVRRTTIRTTT